jgi:hypothetical protein
MIPATLFQLRAARRVFDAGYTIDDMRDALEVWKAEHDRDADTTAERPWWHSVARAIAWSPIFIALSSMYGLARGGNPYPLGFSVVAAITLLPTLTALGVPMLPRMLSAKERTFGRMFWGSRAGKIVERLLMSGRRRSIASHVFRPTERVLGSAVEDLFASLPRTFREQLRDVPDIIARLQAHAKSARESLAYFDGVAGIDCHTALVAARNHARQQLADSVSALETVRLDLLRLRGGDTDLRPTTTVLQAARRIDDDIIRLQNARKETERMVKPIGLDLRPHTPA